MQIPASRSLTAWLLALAVVQAAVIVYLVAAAGRGGPHEEPCVHETRQAPIPAGGRAQGAVQEPAPAQDLEPGHLEPGQGNWCGTPAASSGAGVRRDSTGLIEVGYDTLGDATGRVIRVRWWSGPLAPAAR